MAAIQTRNFPTLVFLFSVLFFSGCSAKLNVFLDAREVSRFLHDLHRDLYLVRQGDVAPILRTPVLSSMIPPIDSHIGDIKFRFNASGKVQYSLWFQSSNETIMRHPWANIPLKGFVPQKTKAFRVKFPCTRKLRGEVLLTINISFSDVDSRGIWGPLSLALKRYCNGGSLAKLNSTSDEFPKATHPPSPQICNKRCNKRHVLQRYCVNDYVIKARIESEVMKSGRPNVRVHVMRMFKIGKVKINTRQLLEKRGQEITCSCGNLKPQKLYLILGKEDKRRRVLFIDDFTSAIEWNRNGRVYIRSQRKKAASCPARRAQD